MSTLRHAASVLIAAALLSSPLAGCSGMMGQMSGGQLVVDAADPCGPQRTAFSQSRDFFSQDLVARVATGAVVGAGVGALIGGLTDGGRGALRGAAIGLAGGVAGGLASAYWQKLSQAGMDQGTLSQTVNQDLRSEVAGVDHTAATFASLRTCRFAQARYIKSDARRSAANRAEAQGRLAQQRAWFDQEVATAEAVGVSMQKRDSQFAYAAEQLQQAPPAAAYGSARQPQARARRAPGSAAIVVATQTLPQKRNSFGTLVETSKAQIGSVFSLDGSATSRNEQQAYERQTDA